MMGTELIRHHVKGETMDIPLIPPGFESFTAAFSLKQVDDNNKLTSNSSVSISASEPQINKQSKSEQSDSEKIKKAVRRRPRFNDDHVESCSGDESESEQNQTSSARISKGVIRGCEECSNCQKVVARWRPEESRMPDLLDAPVFYPTEEEFEDTLKYISSIREKAETYGICRIVPPPSWKPPCPLKEETVWENSTFSTRIQRVDKLQKRDSLTQMLRPNSHKKRKKRRCLKPGLDQKTHGSDGAASVDPMVPEPCFGFEPGPQFTLKDFQKYANDFKTQYFRKNNSSIEDNWEPSLQNIEGEYWRMVERPTEEIEVLYGADLETGTYGSGFPKVACQVSQSDEKYITSGWNLNNFPRLPGSLLSYESSDISGVLIPWLYVGMCFSSFCWHVEDHHLYSMNYMHFGASKMWYGVPGKNAIKLEAAMRKHLPDLFAEQPDLLHKLVTQLSPSLLKSEGVPVFRCVQNPGEFILTFPRAYHSGFNCGFNCAEAVNVAPVDWLPHGHNAIELYREQARRISISHDKLLLGAARDAVKAHWELNLLRKNSADNLRWKDVCGKDGILSQTLKARVEIERVRRDFLCNTSQALKMEASFDATSERECSVCYFDLHLSAAGCHNCSPDKYACLNHAKQFCSCPTTAKFFLLRYDIKDLAILVEALEGKLSAIYRWAKLDLGLALSSYVSKDKQPGLPTKEVSPVLPVSSLNEQTGQEKIQDFLKPKESSTLYESLHKTEQTGQEKIQILKPKESSTTTYESLHKKEQMGQEKIQDFLKPKESSSSYESLHRKEQMGQEKIQDFLKIKESSSVPSVSSLKEQTGQEKIQDFLKPKELSSTPYESLHKKEQTGQEKIQDFLKLKESSSIPSVSSLKEQTGQEKIQDFLKLKESSTINEYLHKDIILLSDDEGEDTSAPINRAPVSEHQVKKEAHEAHPDNLSCHRVLSDKSHDLKTIKGSSNVNTNEDKVVIIGLYANTQNAPGKSQSCTKTNPNQINRKKGPRIAKVVRKINCHVEPLDYGVIQSWCDSRAIYPKGFRTRVKYINVLDVTDTCYYVSEILDMGKNKPLFMVSLENHPSEVSIHLSPTKCWEIIRERVNYEILKQHKLGILNLPPLQPPGSLDGMDMFGFSSPSILQGIQSMDKNRLCTEYWQSRPFHSQSHETIPDATKNNGLTLDAHNIISGFLKKANLEELNTFLHVLSKDSSTSNEQGVAKLLNEEILKRAT